MKNFIFKSNESDLQKMFSILENLQKNVVYITYKVDNIIKIVKSLDIERNLQKQVDSYFDEDSPQDIPEEKSWPLCQQMQLALLQKLIRLTLVKELILAQPIRDLSMCLKFSDSTRTFVLTYLKT